MHTRPQMTSPQLPSRIELWHVDRLKPYERNARTHDAAQVKKIAASITEFGFTNPILVDSSDGIIAGHGRLMAAKELGLGEVPVIVLDHLTDAQRRAYILADNRLALDAGWDNEMLAAELTALQADGFDLDLTGFSGEEIDDLLADGADDADQDRDDDAVPETAKRLVSRRGDVWLLGKHRLICGDSTNLSDIERLTAGEQIECLWTDPPYNVAYEGTAGSIKNDDMEDGQFRQFLHDAFVCAFAVMKPGGAAYIAHADTEGYNFRGAFRDAGFKLSGCLIWRKNSLVLGRSDYQWQHEPILYGWKEGAAHRWYGERNKTTMVEFDGGLFDQIGENQYQITIGEQTLIIEGENLTVREARASVVTEEKPKRNAEHPTMKPVPLIERFLLNSTKRGDTVMDLFGGSGSTLIACEKLGRIARLCELDEKFVDVIVRRWQDYTGKRATLEATGQSYDDVAAGGAAANDNFEGDDAVAV